MSQAQGPSYLPLYGGRQALTADNAGLRDQALSVNVSGKSRFWDNLAKFSASGLNLADAHYQAINIRKARDFDTDVSRIFRERKLEIMTGQRGSNTDDLLEQEDMWQSEARNALMEKTDLPQGLAARSWQKHYEQHIDRMGSYMIEQQVQADKQSRIAANAEDQNNLVMTNVGNLASLDAYNKRVDELFSPNTPDNYKYKTEGLLTLVGSWAEQNPTGTLQWYEKNKGQLREVLGKDYLELTKVTDRLERKMEAEINRSEAMARRSERINDRRQKHVDDTWLNDQLTKMYDEQESESEGFDIRAALKDGKDKGVSGETLVKLDRVVNQVDNRETQKISTQLERELIHQAAVGDWTDENRARAEQLMVDGKLTVTAYKRVMGVVSQNEKAVSAGLRPQLKLANKYLENAIAPSGGMFAANPAAKDKYLKTLAVLTKELEDKTPAEQLQMLDVTNEKSFVRMLASGNAPSSPADYMRGGFNPVDQGQTPVVPKKERKPGESFKEWRDR